MGRLASGTTLDWSEIKKLAPVIRQEAVLQFLRVYEQEKKRQGEPFKWGDEIEFTIVSLNGREQQAQLSLLGPEILPTLQQPEKTDPKNHATKWRPEHSRYQIEGTPGAEPYGDSLSDTDNVERNMKLRQQQLYDILKDVSTEAFPLTISVFPRLGCPKFTSPAYDPRPDSSVMRSLFYPDEVVVQLDEHPRFLALSGNTLKRRERPMVINFPIFRDKHTPNPFKDVSPLAKEDHVMMDCDGFASGCCCLQVTFQASSLQDACYLYDQLAVLSPLMLALTAASPIFRGYLCDVDCRYNALVEACDDRTPGELGLKALREGERVVPRSRWDSSIEGYLATDKYNDQEVPYNEDAYEKFIDAGIPSPMARHFAYAFMRDPLILFEEDLAEDAANGTQHCENLMTTNWQIVRLKLPVPEQNIGWRVEFRTMELQLTSSENAAFAVFVMLLARMIISLRPKFYIPVTKMDENMKRAQTRDAVHREKFYFCKDTFPTQQRATTSSHSLPDSEVTEMDLNTIFNGSGEFVGLISLITKFLDKTGVDAVARAKIDKILKFISGKASGELMTTATWVRKFVTSHPNYRQDSCVSDKLTFDLISKMKLISEGIETSPELKGPL